MGQRNGQPLPDPHCTPATINSGSTQANINQTICKSGCTATVPQSTSKTTKMKTGSASS
jgi:hypothetical protein